jgi:DNA-binding response OmpR family regulator
MRPSPHTGTHPRGRDRTEGNEHFAPMTNLLVYSNDRAFRERVKLAIGRSPSAAVDSIDYLEAADAGSVIDAVDRGVVDLLVLDGEAWPTGGLGVSRELKNSRDDCPPVVVVVGRRDDRWLGTWSEADAVIVPPVDAVELTGTVLGLLTGGSVGVGTTKESL